MSSDSTDALRKTLTEAVRAGRLHDFAPEVEDDDLDPADAATWPAERDVPAELLRTILLDPDLRPDPRGMRLRGARITGTLDLDHVTVPCPLAFISSRLEPAATLDHATLPGLNLVDCHITGLSLDGARVDGDLFLRRLTATGEVRALDAQITGRLDLNRGRLANENGDALSLDRARIDSGAFLERLTVNGAMRALGTHITGQLDLQDARLINEGATALYLDRARVDGTAFLLGLTVVGEVRALGAQITGPLDLQGASLANKTGIALNAERLSVGALFLRRLHSVEGAINLTRAQIGDLVVDDSHARALPGPLVASGWRVEDMHGALRSDRPVAAAWLATQPEFVAQPWHALADVYERNGQPADARRLRLDAARRITKNGPFWSRPPRWAYGLLVGYGYYPLIAAIWLALAFALSSVLIATHTQDFVATDSAKAVAAQRVASGGRTVTGDTACATLGDRYPCLQPALYSLDSVLPPSVGSGQAGAWRPTEDWIVYVLAGLKAFGWVLTALLLAGVTGLLRKV